MAVEILENRKKESQKRKKVAWGMTGCGDRLPETVEIMKQIKKLYENEVVIEVYLSKAGAQVAKYYQLDRDLRTNFEKILVEIDANSPFLAGQLELGKYEFLLIAPATSNTVAKISAGIADSLLSNSAAMALKAFVPVHIVPSDYKEGIITTRLPGGQDMKLRIRHEDVENVKRLAAMVDVSVHEKPEEIPLIFEKHFGSKKD